MALRFGWFRLDLHSSRVCGAHSQSFFCCGGSSSADTPVRVASGYSTSVKLVAPTGTAVEMGTDLNRLVSRQGQCQPQEEPRPAAKFQAEDNISPGVYNPAEEEPIMKALHTLDTRTLLMSTALLISRGKYHSYFILSPLSQGATLRPSPPPVVGELGRCIPTKHWKSCSETSSRKPKGHLIKGPMEAWLGCPSCCSECRYMVMTFLEVQVGTC